MNDRKLTTIQELLAEADAEIDPRFDDKTIGDDLNIIVLAFDRRDVKISQSIRFEYTVEIKKDAIVYAMVSPEKFTDSVEQETINFNARMHNGLAYRMFVALKMLIGSIGVYPFNKIWHRPVPFSWVTEDVSKEPGFRV